MRLFRLSFRIMASKRRVFIIKPNANSTLFSRYREQKFRLLPSLHSTRILKTHKTPKQNYCSLEIVLNESILFRFILFDEIT